MESNKHSSGIAVHVNESNSKKPGFRVSYSLVSPHTGHKITEDFVFNPTSLPSKEYTQTLAEKVIRSRKAASLSGLNKHDPHRIKPRQLRSDMFGLYNKALKSKNPELTMETTRASESGDADDKKSVARLFKEPNVFLREHGDSGATNYFAGRSKSGKTFFLQAELNKIKGLKRGGPDPHVSGKPMYQKIIIMTSSPNAEPLKMIAEELNVTIVPFYLAKLAILMKKINDVTDNKIPFLVILDDVFGSLKGGSFRPLILTLRNANISTTVLSQDVKHCLPETRRSFHNIYITKMSPMEWQYYIGSCLRAKVSEVIGKYKSKDDMAEAWTEAVGENMVWHANTADELHAIKRVMPKKK